MSGTTVVQSGTTYFVTYDTYELGATDGWFGSDRWSLLAAPSSFYTVVGYDSNGNPEYNVTEAVLGTEGDSVTTTLRAGQVVADSQDYSYGLIIGNSVLTVTGSLSVIWLPVQNRGEIDVAAGGGLAAGGGISQSAYVPINPSGGALASNQGLLTNAGRINTGTINGGLYEGLGGVVVNNVLFSTIEIAGIINLSQSGFSSANFINASFDPGSVVRMNGVSSEFRVGGNATLSNLTFQFGANIGTIDAGGTQDYTSLLTGLGSPGTVTLGSSVSLNIANTKFYVSTGHTLVSDTAIISTLATDSLDFNGQAFISGVILPGYTGLQTLTEGVFRNDALLKMAAANASYNIDDIDFYNDAAGLILVSGGSVFDKQITSTFDNAGGVTIGGGGNLFAFDKIFTNEAGGTIDLVQNASGSGSLFLSTEDIQQTFTLGVAGPSWTNDGLISLTSALSTPSGTGPELSVGDFILLNGAGGPLNSPTLTNNGTIVLDAGQLQLGSAVVTGGTIVNDGGNINGGTVSNAVLSGLVTLSGNSWLEADSFVADTVYSAPTLDVSGQVIFANQASLSGVAVNLLAGTGENVLWLDESQLVLGPTTVLTASAATTYLQGFFNGTTLDNQGQINVDGTRLFVQTSVFTNHGAVTVAANAAMELTDGFGSSGVFGAQQHADNAADGSIVVDAGGALTVYQLNSVTYEILSNEGQIQIDNGGLLNGQVDQFNSGSIFIQSGGQLDGTVVGGTVYGAGADVIGSSQISATWVGNMNVWGTAALYGSILPSIAGTGVTIAVSPDAQGFGTAELALGNPLTGNGALAAVTVDIGSSTMAAAWLAANNDVTLGSDVIINQTGHYAGMQTDTNLASANAGTFDLKGTLNANFTNGSFVVQGLGNFINDGVINIANGETLTVDSLFTQSSAGAVNVANGGVLDLEGATNLGAGAVLSFAAGSTLDLAQALTGGTLNLAGVDVAGSSITNSGTLNGVTVNDTPTTITGTVTLQNVTWYGSPIVAGDLILANGDAFLPEPPVNAMPTLDLASHSGTLDFSTAQTFAAAAIALGAAPGLPASVVEIGGTAGGVSVTLASSGTITQSGVAAGGAGALIGGASGSSFDNLGTILANATNGALSIGTLAGFTNAGVVQVSNGDRLSTSSAFEQTASGSLAVAGGATFGVSAAALTIDAGATLGLASGAALLLTGGTITGNGTILGDGATLAGSGTLSASTWLGSPTITGSIALGGGVAFQPSPTSIAAPTIAISGDGATLDATGAFPVLSGVNISLGAHDAGQPAAALAAGNQAQSSSLLLDSTVTLTQSDNFAALTGSSSSTIETDGSVLAGIGGGTFSVTGIAQFTNTGTVSVQNGDALTIQTAVLNTGTFIDQAMASFTGSLFGNGLTGTIMVSNGATASFGGAVAIDQQIWMSGGQITLGDVGAFAGTIENFAGNDQLDVSGETITSAQYLFGQLLLTDSLGNNFSFGFNDTVQPDGTNFMVVPDGSGGTVITDQVACFASGSAIATDGGLVAVEHLAVGDLVVTADGRREAIVWIGHRRVLCARHPRPETVWPVRVAPGAFGPGQPRRSLYLSPDHAVFVDGVLIPVKHLINGSTILQQPRTSVTYWHVELARHEVILADGLACESYLDTGDRASFGNGGPVVRQHPVFGGARWEALACAPLVVTGAALARVRRRLAA